MYDAAPVLQKGVEILDKKPERKGTLLSLISSVILRKQKQKENTKEAVPRTSEIITVMSVMIHWLNSY